MGLERLAQKGILACHLLLTARVKGLDMAGQFAQLGRCPWTQQLVICQAGFGPSSKEAGSQKKPGCPAICWDHRRPNAWGRTGKGNGFSGCVRGGALQHGLGLLLHECKVRCAGQLAIASAPVLLRLFNKVRVLHLQAAGCQMHLPAATAACLALATGGTCDSSPQTSDAGHSGALQQIPHTTLYSQ